MNTKQKTKKGLRQNRFSGRSAVIFVLAFVLIGGYLLLHSFAAGPSGTAGDCDGDGKVGSSDLVALLANWHSTTNLACDFNGSGMIDIGDLSILISHYGPNVNGGQLVA